MLSSMPKHSKQVITKNRALLGTYHAKQCVICGVQGCDPAHIKSQKSGGDDKDENLMALCRRHHTEQHQISWIGMAEKYTVIAFHLAEKGWKIHAYGDGQKTLTRS